MHHHLPKYNFGAHFLTARTFDSAPYFCEKECARIFCEELEAARAHYGFDVLAFVVMPDHIHLLAWWDVEALPELTISKVAWAVKGKSARRVVDYLKRMSDSTEEGVGDGSGEGVGDGSGEGVGDGTAIAHPKELLLQPVRQPRDQAHFRNWRYKIWQQGAGYDFNVYTREKLAQKVNYIHANPVRAGLTITAEDYPWSSAADYASRSTCHPVKITRYAEVI